METIRPLGHVMTSAAVVAGVESVAILIDVLPAPEGSRGQVLFEGWTEAGGRESRIRVVSSLAGLGFLLEGVLVRVSGAFPEWMGAELDLAVAVAVLVACGKLSKASLSGVALIAELTLGGELRPVRGAFALAGGRERGGCRVVIGAEGNRDELGAVGAMRVACCVSLGEVLAVLRGGIQFARAVPDGLGSLPPGRQRDDFERAYSDCLRAVEAGVRVIGIEGSRCSGQTLLARALWQSLPPMGFDERRDVLSIQSAAGLYQQGQHLVRPFRAPHHTVSEAGLMGGSARPRPGELSLAHRGVLFLDELAEFRRVSLDALAVWLSKGEVEVYRKERLTRLPARPCLVVVALSNCPCGWSGSPQCRCSADQRARHRGRDYGRFGQLIELVVRVGGGA